MGARKCGANFVLYGDEEIEKALLYHAGAEVGKVHIRYLLIYAEALELHIEKVELHLSDTATARNSGSVSAVAHDFMSGMQFWVRLISLERWQAGDRPAVGDFVYRPPANFQWIRLLGIATEFCLRLFMQKPFAEVNTQMRGKAKRTLSVQMMLGKQLIQPG
jgi:hypothetical protein